MNCKVFLKKLPEYLDESLMHDMKEAMEKHMDSCEHCRSLYDEEVEFDDLFFGTLQLEEVRFNSSRAEIIKEIDKNRYGKSPLKKMKFGMRKHRLQILSSAAVLAITLTAAPFILGSRHQPNNSLNLATKDTSQSPAAENANQTVTMKAENKKAQDQGMPLQEMKPVAFISDIIGNKVYVPTFDTTKLEMLPDPLESTEPKESPDKNTKVLLYGRGPNAADDQIADIVFQSQKDLSIWKLSLANNDKKQFSPLSVNWYDDENLLVTIGYGRGHSTFGGDLFLVNIYNGKSLNLYPANSRDKNQEVVSAVRNGDIIDLSVKEFDDAHNMPRDYNIKLYFHEVYSVPPVVAVDKEAPKSKDAAISENAMRLANTVEESKAVEVVKNVLVEGLNKGGANSLYSMLGGELLKSDSHQYKELLNIGKARVLRIVDMTKTSENNEEDTETYYTEMEVSMKPEGVIFKNGVNFLGLKLQKDNKGNWILTDITRLPQN